jgi:hypothetical protein
MRPVIVGITLQNPTQMRLAKDDDVIKALAPDRSDQPFSEVILPRCRRCYGLVSNTHGTDARQGDLPNKVAWRFIPGERFSELACDPFRGRILYHVDPDKRSPVQPDHEERIKQAEPDDCTTSKPSSRSASAFECLPA